MKTKETCIKVSSYSFILLWGYAAVTKLYRWEHSQIEMHMQLFPNWVGDILFWFIPLVELALIALLLSKRLQVVGLQLSVALMIIFSLYLLAGITRIFGHDPCICAGILKGGTTRGHLYFNLLFIALGISTLVLAHRSRAGRDVVLDLGRKEDSILS